MDDPQSPWGGWSEWLALPHANDAMVAFLAVVALFLIPSGNTTKTGESERLLIGKLPNGFRGHAIAIWCWHYHRNRFHQFGAKQHNWSVTAFCLPLLLMIATICFAVTFLTGFNNMATTTLLMPILAAAALGAGIDPALLKFSCHECFVRLHVAGGNSAERYHLCHRTLYHPNHGSRGRGIKSGQGRRQHRLVLLLDACEALEH